MCLIWWQFLSAIVCFAIKEGLKQDNKELPCGRQGETLAERSWNKETEMRRKEGSSRR